MIGSTFMIQVWFMVKKFLLLFIASLFILVACQSAPVTISPSPSQSVIPGETDSLSADERSTLSSLEQVDDYPFYVMHYSGGYDYLQAGYDLTSSTHFACSLFAALGEGSDMLYGRNFDWSYTPTLLLYTDPPDGYSSVSLVDLEFLGISDAEAQTLLSMPVEERTTLLSAPSMPIDGMNEYGLTIGMAALPDEYLDDASYDPSKPMIGSIGIIRQVLDHARTVDEAIAIFDGYNVSFTGGPPIHYLIADATGKALLIEFYNHEMITIPNTTPWHLATNHLRYTAKGDGGCQRYRTILEQLSAAQGVLDTQSAMRLLSDASQTSTQWSAVYDITERTITVVNGRNYQREYKFQLDVNSP
jgi:hypothetical protein